MAAGKGTFCDLEKKPRTKAVKGEREGPGLLRGLAAVFWWHSRINWHREKAQTLTKTLVKPLQQRWSSRKGWAKSTRVPLGSALVLEV